MKPKTTYKASLRTYFNNFPKVDDTAFDLLDKMFRLDPKTRITVKEALEHEFFTTHLPKMCDIDLLPKIDKDSHEYQHRKDMQLNEMLNQQQQYHQHPLFQKKDMNIAYHQYNYNGNGNNNNNMNKGNMGHDFLGIKRNLE